MEIHHTINEYINLGFFRLEIQHTFTINEYINSVFSVFIKGLIFYYCYSNDIFQMLILIFSVQRVSFVGVYPRSFAWRSVLSADYKMGIGRWRDFPGRQVGWSGQTMGQQEKQPVQNDLRKAQSFTQVSFFPKCIKERQL